VIDPDASRVILTLTFEGRSEYTESRFAAALRGHSRDAEEQTIASGSSQSKFVITPMLRRSAFDKLRPWPAIIGREQSAFSGIWSTGELFLTEAQMTNSRRYGERPLALRTHAWSQPLDANCPLQTSSILCLLIEYVSTSTAEE
jgi:hypothetical protein